MSPSANENETLQPGATVLHCTHKHAHAHTDARTHARILHILEGVVLKGPGERLSPWFSSSSSSLQSNSAQLMPSHKAAQCLLIGESAKQSPPAY